MTEAITQALTYLIQAIIVAITGIVTYYIKTVLVPWLEDKQLYTTVQRYVQAAEKLAEAGGLNTGKKEYVVKLLQGKGIEITPEIEALIESAVEELDWMKNETLTTIIGQADEAAAPVTEGADSDNR